MQRLLRRCGSLALASLLPLIASPLHAATLLVVCQAGAAVSVVDTATLSETHRIPLAAGPASLLHVPQTHSVYVTHPDAGLLSRIDAQNLTNVTTVPIGGQPFGITADDQQLYVGDWSANTVRRFHLPDLQLTGTVAVGPGPAGLALDPERQELYSADREGGTVSVVDLVTLQTRATIPVGTAPYAFDTSKPQAILNVADVRKGRIARVDKARHTVTYLPTGKMPYGLATDPQSGRILVANQQSATLTLLDPSQPDRTLQLRAGTAPESVIVDSPHRRAYVTDWFADQVLVVDLEKGAVTAAIPVAAGPRNLIFLPGS